MVERGRDAVERGPILEREPCGLNPLDYLWPSLAREMADKLASYMRFTE